MSDNIMPVYHNFLFQVQKAVHPYKFRLSSRHLPSFLCTLGKKIPRVHFSRSVCTLIAIISHFVLFFNLFYVISLCFYAITTKIPFFTLSKIYCPIICCFPFVSIFLCLILIVDCFFLQNRVNHYFLSIQIFFMHINCVDLVVKISCIIINSF